MVLVDRFDQLQAIAAGERKIDNDDVRFQFPHLAQGTRFVRRVAADIPPLFAADQQSHAVAHQFMVIHQKHTNLGGHGLILSA